MPLIAIWFVSIDGRSIIHSKYFSLNSKRSKLPAIHPSLTAKGEDEFVTNLLTSLGLLERSISVDGDDDLKDLDCTQSNQMPAVSIEVSGCILWPLLVIENRNLLFCGLPLIEDVQSKELIDQITVSEALTALHLLVQHFTLDTRLISLERFYLAHMPFGSIIPPLDLKRDLPVKEYKKSESKDSLVTIRLNECISSCQMNNEIVYGTVLIDHQPTLPKTSLTLRINSINDYNILASPDCTLKPKTNCIQVRINADSVLIPKFFHYKCNDIVLDKVPFIQYQFKVIRSMVDTLLKVELVIETKKLNEKFSLFNIHFVKFPRNQINQIVNNTVSHGNFNKDSNGIVWSIGSKFPRSGRARLTMDVDGSRVTGSVFEALCMFRISRCSYGLTDFAAQSSDSHINQQSIILRKNLSSFDYKLIPNFSS